MPHCHTVLYVLALDTSNCIIVLIPQSVRRLCLNTHQHKNDSVSFTSEMLLVTTKHEAFVIMADCILRTCTMISNGLENGLK